MTQAAKIDTAEILKGYIADYESHARDCIYIRDHNTAKILPLKFNRGQRILHAVAEKQKAEKGVVRILFLKSRRFGGSTYVQGRFYSRTSLNFNRNAFIVAHEKESTNTLFEMTKLMQERNPIAPAELRNNEKSLKFDSKQGTGLKSEYRLATAENVDAGRSQGIHYLHCSEEAFWRDGKTLLLGLMQCVPDPPAESEVFRESTANGYGDSFQGDVTESYAEGRFPYYIDNGRVYAWSSPDTDWVLVFIPWFEVEQYTRVFDSTQARDAFIAKANDRVFDQADMRWIDSETKRLKAKFDLTYEQLHWREWAIKNKCGGSVDKFHQEYPSTVEEAFLTQGSNVFGKELCDDIDALCEPPLVMGDVVLRAGKTRIRANRHGKFSLWEKPDEKETYFLTVDAAGGIKKRHRDEGKEPDRTNIDVWNHRTGAQAAQWNGHIEYDMIADTVEMIGRMFFKAPACVELMNHGYTVVADLKRLKYPMYEAKPGEPGWLTTAKTKPVMVDSLYRMSRDADIQIRSGSTVSEMRTFIEESGRYEAAQGCKDDRVDTAAMASQMMTLLPRKFREMRGEKEPFVGFNNFRNKVPRDSGEYREVTV